jgi:hypothetical protein
MVFTLRNDIVVASGRAVQGHIASPARRPAAHAAGPARFHAVLQSLGFRSGASVFVVESAAWPMYGRSNAASIVFNSE